MNKLLVAHTKLSFASVIFLLANTLLLSSVEAQNLPAPTEKSTDTLNADEQKAADELLKVERKKAEQRAMKERDAQERVNQQNYLRELEQEKAALAKALLAVAPREAQLKRQWLEWSKANSTAKHVVALHTSLYIDELSDAEKVEELQNLKQGDELFQGMSLFARDLLGLTEPEFISGIKEIASFRKTILKGNGLSNLLLADWSNHLIYSLICARCLNPQGASIKTLQIQIGLIDSVWSDWDSIARTLGSEFKIDIVYKPISITKLENARITDPHLDFAQFHVVGQRIRVLSRILNEKGVFDKLKQHLAQKKPYRWTDLEVASFLFLKSRLDFGGNVYGEYICSKYELDQFCRFLIANPKFVSLSLREKYRLDEPGYFSEIRGLPYTEGLYKHGNYTTPFNIAYLFGMWQLSKRKREGFQVGRLLNLKRLYIDLADVHIFSLGD